MEGVGRAGVGLPIREKRSCVDDASWIRRAELSDVSAGRPIRLSRPGSAWASLPCPGAPILPALEDTWNVRPFTTIAVSCVSQPELLWTRETVAREPAGMVSPPGIGTGAVRNAAYCLAKESRSESMESASFTETMVPAGRVTSVPRAGRQTRRVQARQSPRLRHFINTPARVISPQACPWRMRVYAEMPWRNSACCVRRRSLEYHPSPSPVLKS